MTFNEWWTSIDKRGLETRSGVDLFEVLCKMTWNAAIEASAKQAERHYVFGHSVAGPEFADAGAQQIRSLKLCPPQSELTK